MSSFSIEVELRITLFEFLLLRASVSDFNGTGLSQACPIDGKCALSSTGIWQTILYN